MGRGRSRVGPVAGALGVLTLANVSNNRIARRWAPVTSAAATAALVTIARRDGLTWAELGFSDAGRGAGLGGALAAGVAAVYAAGVAVPRTRPLFLDERALALSRARLLEEALVQVPIGTVLLEEVAFRGVLPALLGRSLPARTAGVAAAALFGLWHVLPAIDMARANPALGHLASGSSPATTGHPTSGSPAATIGHPTSGSPAATTGHLRSGLSPATVGRLVAGTVASTTVAGLFFGELRRRGGLLAPALTHLGTNSLGYVAARLARRLDRDRRERG
ncbi:CPBP family glutamic-type intramembrane protease [Microtetraspora fusca]|uniref:CPBP family glutamic-type intramembrane protease n=1 Tax=Microtetraspora fusca TaxID=1997 RepID=UPI00083440C2|nr:CPBP family glutamic-type intramembrane protease [Microtetraspora fusca]